MPHPIKMSWEERSGSGAAGVAWGTGAGEAKSPIPLRQVGVTALARTRQTCQRLVSSTWKFISALWVSTSEESQEMETWNKNRKPLLSRGQQNKKGCFFFIYLFFFGALRKELLTRSPQADIFMRKQIWVISFTACKH